MSDIFYKPYIFQSSLYDTPNWLANCISELFASVEHTSPTCRLKGTFQAFLLLLIYLFLWTVTAHLIQYVCVMGLPIDCVLGKQKGMCSHMETYKSSGTQAGKIFLFLYNFLFFICAFLSLVVVTDRGYTASANPCKKKKKRFGKSSSVCCWLFLFPFFSPIVVVKVL